MYSSIRVALVVKRLVVTFETLLSLLSVCHQYFRLPALPAADSRGYPTVRSSAENITRGDRQSSSTTLLRQSR